MGQTLLMAGVAAGGVLLGTVFTAVGSVVVARMKIREIEVTFAQKLQESYLLNARAVAADCYIPLNIALTRLVSKYRRFREWLPHDVSQSRGFREDFKVGCIEFCGTYEDLVTRGADAYYTSDLEEKLISFTNFLENSVDAADVKKTAIATFSIGDLSFRKKDRVGIATSMQFRTISSLYKAITLFGFLTPRFEYNDVIIQAPINGQAFDEHFEAEIIQLRALIKDVTLGVRPK